MTADDALKTVPDKLRRLEARTATIEDRLEVMEHRRSTWVPSRSFQNMSGRQREIVLFVALCVMAEVIHLLARRLDRAAPAA